MLTVCPCRTRATGARPSGMWPHTTVSGVDRTCRSAVGGMAVQPAAHSNEAVSKEARSMPGSLRMGAINIARPTRMVAAQVSASHDIFLGVEAAGIEPASADYPQSGLHA